MNETFKLVKMVYFSVKKVFVMIEKRFCVNTGFGLGLDWFWVFLMVLNSIRWACAFSSAYDE